MMIGPIDHGHAHRFFAELLRRFESAKAGAHNHDMRFSERRVSIGAIRLRLGCEHLFCRRFLEAAALWGGASAGPFFGQHTRRRHLTLLLRRSGYGRDGNSAAAVTLPESAATFRALCRKRSRAAKPGNPSRNGSRSPGRAKSCGNMLRAGICFPRRAPSASATWRSRPKSIRRTRPGSSRTCRSGSAAVLFSLGDVSSRHRRRLRR